MKKKISFNFVSLIFLLFLQFNGSDGPDPVDKFAAKISKKIAEKYHINACGIGGGATKEGVWLVNVKFNRKGTPLNAADGRKLIINISEEFLKFINENEEIRPLLKVHPFTSHNIHIAIFCYDYNGKEILDPYLDTLSVSNGEVGFFTQDHHNKYKFKSEIYEPYAEALAIVQNESNEGK